jgi:hypothetical protein
VFPLWYGASLIVLLGAVETGRMRRGADPDRAPPVFEPPTRAVVALPPKPDASPPAARSGAADDTYTWERCDGLSGDYADACFAALARQRAERDPDGALAACARVTESERALECRADVAEGHARVDLDRSRAICAALRSDPAPLGTKWGDQCVFGLANAQVHADPALALALCEESGQWRPFCRHDVNGERATVDPDGAVAYCESLPAERRDTCWHGIGKYVSRVDVARGIALCDRAPLDGDLRGQCVHGVGWAAAESHGEGALPHCETLGPMRDSCILGIAYHQKRFDPEGAKRLCGLARDAAERARCLDFVHRRR